MAENGVPRLPDGGTNSGEATDKDSSLIITLVWTSLAGLLLCWYMRPSIQAGSPDISNDERRKRMAEAAANRLMTQSATVRSIQVPDKMVESKINSGVDESGALSKESTVPQHQAPLAAPEVTPDVELEAVQAPPPPPPVPEKVVEEKETIAAAPTPETTTATEQSVSDTENLPDQQHPTANAAPKAKRKKRRRPPMPQIFCEALSEILQVHIVVEQRDDAEAWGGLGWWKSANKHAAIISLPLHRHYSAEYSQDGEMTQGAIEELARCLVVDLVPRAVDIVDLQHAISIYNRAAEIARVGHSPHLLSRQDAGFLQFVSAVQKIKAWVIAKAAEWLESDDSITNYQAAVPGDVDIGDDLFSDEYDTSVLTPTPLTDATADSADRRSLAFLIDLLVNSPSQISIGFLVDVNDAVEVCSVSEKIVGDLLRRLNSQIFPMNEPSQRQPDSALSQEATKVLGAIGTVLTSAKLATSAAHRLIEAAVSDLQEKQSSVSVRADSGDHHNGGRSMEQRQVFVTLFTAVAYSLDDSALLLAHKTRSQQRNRPTSFPSMYLRELETLQAFPACVFTAQSPKSPLQQQMKSSHRMIAQALSVSERFLKIALKNKRIVFEFLRQVVETNQRLIDLPKVELVNLDADSAMSEAASMAFLNGLAYALVGFCGTSLQDRFQQKGHGIFDAAYFDDLGFNKAMDSPLFVNDTSTWNSASTVRKKDAGKYSGSTELFFLTSAMLRLGMQTLLKKQKEFRNVHGRLFDELRVPQHSKTIHPRQLKYDINPKVAALSGFACFLNNAELMTPVTNYYLLQLEWVLSVCINSEQKRLLLPDWICKDVSRWLGYVAKTSPHLLTPIQTDRAVDCCAKLLQLGIADHNFSPIVITALVRVASNFINVSVDRAWHRQRNARKGPKVEDTRVLEIYTSFDAKDLGVAVFANEQVCTTFCPTLIQTFYALDAVEGLDMDREIDFDKFGVKSEVADLLMRLWAHPNGKCRASVVAVSGDRYLRFVGSVVSALAVFLDDAVQKLGTVLKMLRQESLSDIDKRFVDGHLSGVSSGLLGSRRLLMLLTKFSHEEQLCRHLCGVLPGSERALRDVCNAFVHFFDILTQADGGTNPELEIGLSKSTSQLRKDWDSLGDDDKKSIQKEIQDARSLASAEGGLNVSIICHQLMALLAKWHLSFSDTEDRADQPSPILKILAKHEDVDPDQYHGILNRLIQFEPVEAGDDPAHSLLAHDGYAFEDMAEECGYDFKDSSRRKQRSKHDQITHRELQNIASDQDILKFLDELAQESAAHRRDEAANTTDPKEAKVLEATIMHDSNVASFAEQEATYENAMSDWVVSSSPFMNEANRFRHFYDASARSKSTQASSKTLIAEARKCHKLLPTPHANSSIFVCFAEERMDLCRAMITGPVDTPYSLGLFTFDIFFPSSYPNSPPLVTFMTTGGGQIRFSPNLYVDGKVCLSLLGLTFSRQDHERWTPKESSIAQVLISIQSQIFDVAEPYFNEGSGIPQFVKQTAAGKEGSWKHNLSLRLATLRYAVLDVLRNPPCGLESAAVQYFSLCRKRIVVQAHRWMLESKSTQLFAKYQKVYRNLVSTLADTKYSSEKALQPRKDDVDAILQLEASESTVLLKGMPTPSDEAESESVTGVALDAVDTCEADQKQSGQSPETSGADYPRVEVPDEKLGVGAVEATESATAEPVANNPWAQLSHNANALPQERQQVEEAELSQSSAPLTANANLKQSGSDDESSDDDEEEDMYS